MLFFSISAFIFIIFYFLFILWNYYIVIINCKPVLAQLQWLELYFLRMYFKFLWSLFWMYKFKLL